MNLAVAGDSPWVRVNAADLGNAVDATYGYGNLPVFYSETMSSHHGMSEELILEMAAMPPLAGTGVENEQVSAEARLLPACPNPFNPRTVISFELGRAGLVSLVVYDITGRRVRRLVTHELAQGLHPAVWDGRDEAGRAVSSGVYCSRLEFHGRSQTGKLVLLK